jgi:hypothetical protein
MESPSAAYGVYTDKTDVSEVVRTLNGASFENEDICVLLAPTHPIADVVRSASGLTAQGDDSAATAGLISWLSHLGAVVIPKVGFFIRSRVFFSALVVSRNAPALCGDSRTLVGLGFSEEDADRFEEQMAHAGFMVYVASEEFARLLWAIELMRATGAEETATLEKEERASAFA